MSADLESFRALAVERATSLAVVVTSPAWVEPHVAAFPDGSSVVRRRELHDELRVEFSYLIFGDGSLAREWTEVDRRRIVACFGREKDCNTSVARPTG